MTVLNLIRPELLNGSNYRRSEMQGLYRLHANELPWSPASLCNVKLNQYPDSNQEEKLITQLAQCYQINSKQLTLTRGSDDAIDFITRIFLTPSQDALMQFSPTFTMYAYYVRLQQGVLIDCPLDAKNGFSNSLETIKHYWKSNCKIIMFCNPNNPTANLAEIELIAQTCREFSDKSIVVVDEAYIEFAKGPSALSLLPEFENLIVLRTLSKARGLAGLRLGSIIAQEHIIEAINKVIPPYIHSSPSLSLASQAVEREDWFNYSLEQVTGSRDCLIQQLNELKVIKKVYPSETNFILIQSDLSDDIARFLYEYKIHVRMFSNTSILHDHLRITVGNDEENKLLIDSLAQFMRNKR